MRRRNLEVLLAALLSVLFLLQILLARGFPWDARLFPTLIGAAGLVLSITALVMALWARKDSTSRPAVSLRPRLVGVLLAPPLYGALLWALGFWIASAVVVPALAWMLGYRQPVVLTLAVALTLAVIGVAFPWLEVRLPPGQLF